MWLILSEMPGGPGPFTSLKQFHVEPNSVFDIPIHFKPKTIGKHEVCKKNYINTEFQVSSLGDKCTKFFTLVIIVYRIPTSIYNVA